MTEDAKSKTATPSANEGTNKLQLSINSITLWQVLTGVLLIVLISSLLTGGFGLIKQPCPSNNDGGDGTTEQLQTVPVDVGSNPPLGQADAPVMFIEFSDYQCPFCARQYRNSITQLENDYVKNGKVKMYFRDFPLYFHDKAMVAAEAARCAGEKGKYWEMHDKIFQNNGAGEDWTVMTEGQAMEKFTQWATAMGVNADEFMACLQSKKYESEINADMQVGQQLGVSGTPTSFIVIPKKNGNLNSLKTIAAQYPNNIYVMQDGKSSYVMVVIGALPYTTYQAILNSVSYA